MTKHQGMQFRSVPGGTYDPSGYRYADHPLPSGTAKIDRRQSISIVNGRLREKSTVDSRFRPSTVDFDRRRSIEGEEEKKKEERRRRKKYLLFPCRPRPRTVAALIHGRFFSRAGRKIEVTYRTIPCIPILYWISTYRVYREVRYDIANPGEVYYQKIVSYNS
ncbi:hypothetical protein BHE74_00021542 [Ensete ventricosum]|nr:hypothetical protein BHE74_00021542 [Ensete ventricosum]RZS17168.1 hypothetical protein BHM03_00049288 [Ensete ventricosum]